MDMANDSGKSAGLSIIRGLGAAIGVTLPGMATLSLLVVYAHLSDGVLMALNQALKLIAIFVGVWTAVGPGGTRGLALGAVIGLAYIALGYGACAVWDGILVTGWMLAVEFLLGMLLGGISGALIANLPAKAGRRRKAARA